VNGSSDATRLPLGEKATRWPPSLPGRRPIALLLSLDAIDALADDVLPAALTELAAAQAQIAARLAVRRPKDSPEVVPDEVLDVRQAAQLIGRSVTWLRRHGNTLPGFSQPGGKGTAARWWRNALQAWAIGDAHN
jgi:hypothetical protein